MRDSRERFTDRVDDYVRYRPGYPQDALDWIVRGCGLGPGKVVADLGSGTGILSRLLLASGARVLGVEPNAAMRAAAERQLGGEERFQSVDGSAEATGLGPSSVDAATAGQAFHWFDAHRARTELARILRRGGRVALAWNMRSSTPFNDDYEAMLVNFAPEYPASRALDRAAEPAVRAFFWPAEARVGRFPSGQQLDEAGLRGRLLSSSYAPKPGAPEHAPMMRRLAEIFAAHARDGHVELAYETVVFLGQLEATT
ncbi:MAG TPA: methyltransferase domain-containing protein [Polyangiaceae bacterium]|jgi:SAM-dependent methyltransferase